MQQDQQWRRRAVTVARRDVEVGIVLLPEPEPMEATRRSTGERHRPRGDRRAVERYLRFVGGAARHSESGHGADFQKLPTLHSLLDRSLEDDAVNLFGWFDTGDRAKGYTDIDRPHERV